MEIKRLFLSSTGRDLSVYREATYSRLQAIPDVKVIRMEDFASSERTPVETCIAAVQKSDIYVGLVGFNFGGNPPGDSRSFTQIEYAEATLRKIPCLMHVAPAETRFPISVRESDELFSKQAAFRDSLRLDRTLGRSEHWQSPELLASFVSEAVSQTLNGMGAAGIEERFSSARSPNRNSVTPSAPATLSRPENPPVTLSSKHQFAPELVLIPRGRFQMGSTQDELDRDSCEGPRRDVVIHRPFAFGRYPVTVAEFALFAKQTNFNSTAMYVWQEQGWRFDRDSNWKDPGFAQTRDHPVVGVSYDDAIAYCQWLSIESGELYRLPSEAEWEYCCRAGTTSPFWWGDDITPIQANYDARAVYIGGGSAGEFRRGTVPVHSFQDNPWGLYQMHGNVWEWCADAWNDNYQSGPMNGEVWSTGDSSRAPVRGGSWLSIPCKLRSAKRDWDGRDLRGDTIGFRVVKETR